VSNFIEGELYNFMMESSQNLSNAAKSGDVDFTLKVLTDLVLQGNIYIHTLIEGK
jgi:hypothetical protein